jgi:MFS family permease
MALHATADVNRIEAPVTWKAYLLCAFASLGGMFFGYDSGYINGVNGSKVFINLIDPGNDALTAPHSSLIVSILSAGTFFGALIAGDVADMIGRKWTVIIGCIIYAVGIVIELITGTGGDSLGVIVAGRLVAGIGAGFESAIVILYMSEIVSHPEFNHPDFSPTLFILALDFLVNLFIVSVPQISSWCHRCLLPVLRHHRSLVGLLRSIRFPENHYCRILPYPYWSPVYLGLCSRCRPAVPS